MGTAVVSILSVSTKTKIILFFHVKATRTLPRYVRKAVLLREERTRNSVHAFILNPKLDYRLQ